MYPERIILACNSEGGEIRCNFVKNPSETTLDIWLCILAIKVPSICFVRQDFIYPHRTLDLYELLCLKMLKLQNLAELYLMRKTCQQDLENDTFDACKCCRTLIKLKALQFSSVRDRMT